MKKVILFITTILSASILYAGFNLGMVSAVKKKVDELDEKVQDKIDSETDVAEGIIKGPDSGEGTNNGDQVFHSLAVSPSDPDVVFLGTECNGNFKSIDGGSTWNWLREGLRYSIEMQEYAETWDIAIAPSNEDVVYFAMLGGPGRYENIKNEKSGVYRSVNGGETVTYKLNNLPNANAHSLAISASDPYTVYVGIGGGYTSDGTNRFFSGGIFKSINGGDSWTEMELPSGADECTFDKIILWDANTIFTAGGIDSSNAGIGLIKSTDGGDNWTDITPSGIIVDTFDVSAQDVDYIYIREYNTYKIHISTDGANTWRSYSTGRMGCMAVSPHDKKTILYNGYNSLWKSTDALVTDGYQVFDQSANDIEFSKSDPNIVYAAANGYKVYKSTDGGDSFSLIADLRAFIDSY